MKRKSLFFALVVVLAFSVAIEASEVTLQGEIREAIVLEAPQKVIGDIYSVTVTLDQTGKGMARPVLTTSPDLKVGQKVKVDWIHMKDNFGSPIIPVVIP